MRCFIYSLVVVIGLLCCMSVVHAQRAGIRPRLEGSAFGFEFIPPLTRAEVDRYAAILALSDAQLQFAESEFLKYQEEVKELDASMVPSLRDDAEICVKHAMQQDQAITRFQSLQAVLRIRTGENSLCHRIEDLDDRFFKNLSSVLAEEQKLALQRISLHRQRNRCLKQAPTARSLIDLALLIEQLNFDADTMRDIDLLLHEYEVKVTPLIVKREQQRRHWSRKAIEWDLQSEFDAVGKPAMPKVPAAQQMQKDIQSTTAEYRRMTLDLIATVNERYFPVLIDALPKSQGRQLRESYLTAAYPGVFPDSSDPTAFYEKLVADNLLSDDLKSALISMWQTYRSGYENDCEIMRKTVEDWEAQQALGSRDVPWESHNLEMRERSDLRMKRNIEFVERMKELLPANVLERHAKSIDIWLHDQKRWREVMKPKPAN